jgi:hypothetical protein
MTATGRRRAGIVSLRVFGCLPVTDRGDARRQASEKPRGRKPRGSSHRRWWLGDRLSGQAIAKIVKRAVSRLRSREGSIIRVIGVIRFGPTAAHFLGF